MCYDEFTKINMLYINRNSGLFNYFYILITTKNIGEKYKQTINILQGNIYYSYLLLFLLFT
jgi:hypothetical protein